MADDSILGLMNQLGSALTELDGIERKPITLQKIKAKDDVLKWEQFEETKNGVYPFGWILHVGYTVEWDEDVSVWVHRAFLATGKRDIELQLNEIDVNELEAVIAEGEYEAARRDAEYLARDEGDRGEYALDAQRDRLAMLEPTERK